MSLAEILDIVLVAVLVIITGYYAWQTNRQANFMKKQLGIIVDQRTKSIAPIIQIKVRGYHTSIITSENKKIVTPNLVAEIHNVGKGPALDLSLYCEARVSISRNPTGDVNKTLLMKWQYHDGYGDIYLDEQEYKEIKLALIVINPVDDVLQSTAGFVLTYRNLDGQLFDATKSITLPPDVQKRMFDGFDNCLMPGEEGYPQTIQLRQV